MDEVKETKLGLTAEEKEAQILNAESSSLPGKVDTTINDDDVFNPPGKEVELSGKKYLLKPLKLSEMRIMMRLSQVKLGKGEFNEEQIDTIVECLSKILKESDKTFIEDNLDAFTMSRLFKSIQDVNYSGVPAPTKSDRKLAGN
jgi:hypothetical protein